VWDPGKNEWVAHDVVIPIATHGMCPDCHQKLKEEDAAELDRKRMDTVVAG
jgi:hypothetical protein